MKTIKTILVVGSVVIASYVMTAVIATVGEVSQYNSLTEGRNLSVTEELYKTLTNPLGEW